MDFLFRIAILALGYFYPAYKCFKFIDSGKFKSEELHVWCQYWIIIAVFTGFERVADIFISWLPFYSGAKLAFVVYLWHPDAKGTEYIYQTFVEPYLSKHREAVDLNLVLVRDEAVRVLTILWDRFMYTAQLKVSGVLHQNAVPSRVQDSLHFYPSISSPSCGSTMPLQQWSFPGHQPLITQSASWPCEQYQVQSKALAYPARALIDLPLGPHLRPTQLSSHHALRSTPVPKLANVGAATKSSTAFSSIVDPKSKERNEEIDFELVHSNEVPVLESSGAPDLSKINTPAQAARSRWSWWW